MSALQLGIRAAGDDPAPQPDYDPTVPWYVNAGMPWETDPDHPGGLRHKECGGPILGVGIGWMGCIRCCPEKVTEITGEWLLDWIKGEERRRFGGELAGKLAELAEEERRTGSVWTGDESAALDRAAALTRELAALPAQETKPAPAEVVALVIDGEIVTPDDLIAEVRELRAYRIGRLADELAQLRRVRYERDKLIRAARAAGMSKHAIYEASGIARTTIDRILGDQGIES